MPPQPDRPPDDRRAGEPVTAVDQSGTTTEDAVLAQTAAIGFSSAGPAQLRCATSDQRHPDNGSAITNGRPITLASGATLTINTDGSYSYEPDHPASSSASRSATPRSDSFTYTVTDSHGAPPTNTRPST